MGYKKIVPVTGTIHNIIVNKKHTGVLETKLRTAGKVIIFKVLIQAA